MSNETIVVNASPLICLFKAELEYLLEKLWRRATVPEDVWDEVSAGPITDRAARLIQKTQWINRVGISRIHPSIAGWDLGLGESEVLTFAFQRKNARAILDDAEARRCARTLGIPVIGTGGVLVYAKRRGLISSVSAKIESMKKAGLWLSEEIIAILKRQSGE